MKILKTPILSLMIGISVSIQAHGQKSALNDFRNQEQTQPSSYLDCDNEVLDVTIELTNTGTRIVIPERIQLITPEFDGYVQINICAKDYRTKIEQKTDSLHLQIVASFLNTTLDPVKIPPPDPPGTTINSSRQKNVQCFWNDNVILPWDAGNDINPPSPLRRGNHSIGMSLRQNNIVLDEISNIPLKVYSFSDTDLKSIVSKLYYGTSNNNVIVRCEFETDLEWPKNHNYRMKLYASGDTILDRNDTVIGNQLVNYPEAPFFFEISTNLYNNLVGKYIIAEIDPENVVEEVCENNNWNAYQITKPIDQLDVILPNFDTQDGRIYQRHPEKIHLSCKVNNLREFNAPEELQLGMYVKDRSHQLQLIHKIPVGKLQSRESKVIRHIVTQQYYNNILKGKELVFIVDPDNQFKEGSGYETDNKQRIYNENININSSKLISAKHNASESKIDFNFTTTFNKQHVQVFLYNHGDQFVKFVFSSSPPLSGNQTRSISDANLPNGKYYYSAHFRAYPGISNWRGQLFNHYNGSFFKGKSSDLSINKLVVSNKQGTNAVSLKFFVVNNGNKEVNAPSLINFYFPYSSTFPKVADKTILTTIKPQEEKVTEFLVKKDYYYRYMANSIVAGQVDVNDKITEFNEKNNLLEFRAPYPKYNETITVYPSKPGISDIRFDIAKKKGVKEKSPLLAYPNPFTDKITFSFPAIKNSSVVLKVYNITGVLLDEFFPQTRANENLQDITYENSSLPKGIYFYTLSVDNEQYHGSMIKE